MRFTRTKIIGLVAGVAALVLTTTPAQAGSMSITDASGVDYDAACVQGLWPVGPPNGTAAATPNSIASPGLSGSLLPPFLNGSGCFGVSLYDGSTESTDLTAASMSTGSAGSPCNGFGFCMHAHWTASKNLPAPGDTSVVAADTPAGDSLSFTQLTMFQNVNSENNADNLAGGCTRIGGIGRVRDQHGAYQDGYHFFLAYDVSWDGTKWVHTANVGEYDPSPDGGLIFTELGTNDGFGGWRSADPHFRYGIEWQASYSGNNSWVWMQGIHSAADSINCAGGVFKTAYVTAGNTIYSTKSLTTVNKRATLPVEASVSISCVPTNGLFCKSNVTALGGYYSVSDVTDGNSANNGLIAGTLRPNVTGIAYTPGIVPMRSSGAINGTFVPQVGDSRGGSLGAIDTLGDGPGCPTPTYGGLLPDNPLLVTGQACQIDDDAVGRGSLFAEFWDTTHGFTA